MSTAEFGAAMAGGMILASIAIPDLSHQLGKFFVKLIGALGTISVATVPQSQLLAKSKEQAREEQKTAVISKTSKRKGSLLFHYSDRVAVQMIYATQQLYCGAAYKGHLGGEVTYPAGAYATDIPPWSSGTTQQDLANKFFGGNLNKDVSWWVALDGEEFSYVYGSANQYVRHCPAGDFVDVDVFMFGPNLMDP